MVERKSSVKPATEAVAYLPPSYVPTHQTGGLPGFPAIDVFAPAGAPVVAGFWGRVVKISGRDVSQGGVPGGAYGRSVYVLNLRTGVERYVTHMEKLRVRLGTQVKPGRHLGTVADSAVSGKPGTSHAHLGTRRP